MRNSIWSISTGQLLRTGLFLAVLAFTGKLQGSEITFTITGTVLGGVDQTGVFGFSPETPLNGQPFLLVYRFNDQRGSEGTLNFNGVPYESSITGTDSQSPGTAVLSIHGISFTFGELPAKYAGTTVSSTAKRAIRLTGASGSNYVEEDVKDSYFRPGGGAEVNYVDTRVSVETSRPAFTTEYDWRSSLTYILSAEDSAGSAGSFLVRDETHLPASSGAYGQLKMHTITINGLNQTSSAPEPGTFALLGMCL